MPIDWGTVLDGQEQDTARVLAERDAIANLIFKTVQMDSMDEQRRAAAELRKAQAEAVRQNAVRTLAEELGPNADITNDPDVQQRLKDVGLGSKVKTTPASGGAAAVPISIPGVGGFSTPEIAPSPEKVTFEGTHKQQRELQRQKDIQSYFDETDEARRKVREQKLQLDYGIKSGVFNGQRHLYVVDPATATVQSLGTVPENAKVITKSAAAGSPGEPIAEGPFLEQAARYYIATGKVPFSLGRGGIGSPAGRSLQKQVDKEYLERAKTGIASGDMALAAASYKALSSSLGFQTKFVQSLIPMKESAEKQIDLALEASARVGRTGSKWLNEKVLLALRGTIPHTELSDFDVKVYTALREYAKVVTGSHASIAELSAAAVEHANKLLSSSQDGQTFAAAAQSMKDDMNALSMSQVDHLEKMKQELSGLTNPLQKAQEKTAAPGPAPGTPGHVRSDGARFYAKGKNGPGYYKVQ